MRIARLSLTALQALVLFTLVGNAEAAKGFLRSSRKAGRRHILSAKTSGVNVGDKVVMTSDPDKLKSAFKGSPRYLYTAAMNSILGKTVPVLEVADDGAVGLEEAEPNSPSPIWYYPIGTVESIIQAGAPPPPASGGQKQCCAQQQKQCMPQCAWNCGAKICDQTCKPKCKPPRCQTRCQVPQMISVKSCKMDCNKSDCAVICPHKCHPDTGCPMACQTQCGMPTCKLNCTEAPMCKEVCENPICEWECTKPAQCPQPNCTMSCATPKSCAKDTYRDMPPVKANEVVVDSFAAKTNVTGASFLSVPVAFGVALAAGSGELVNRTIYLPRQGHGDLR